MTGYEGFEYYTERILELDEDARTVLLEGRWELGDEDTQ